MLTIRNSEKMSGSGSRVAGKHDIFEAGTVRIAKVRARAVDNATLTILLEEDVDAVRSHMVERRLVAVLVDHEGMMDSVRAFLLTTDRRVAFYQDHASTTGIEKGHLAVRNGGKVLHADDFSVEVLAALYI